MKKKLSLLLVEDSTDDAELIVQTLSSGGYAVEYDRVFNADAMHEALSRKNWDIIISDYSMPQFSGLEALEVLNESGQDIPFILVSGTAGEDIAVKAMKKGASDYLMKDNLMRLIPAVDRELDEHGNRVSLKIKEEQLRQVQKMEIVGQLAAGVVHDLNNKLGAIMMIAESASSKVPKDDKMHRSFRMINEAASFSVRLVKQLLLFGRVLPTNPEVINLNDAISTSVKTLKHLIPEDCVLSFVPSKEPLQVKVDSVQFDQVIFNLVLNAKDAMSVGGKIMIEALSSKVTDSSNTLLPVNSGEYAVLRVRDTGEGMSNETRARIFEPFFTTKPVGKGTGLGLSIIYGIVKAAGGTISVESSPGQGTTFDIFFPKVQEKVDSQENAQEVQVETPFPKAKVLLVEDDLMLREATSEILHEAGLDLQMVPNGVEALKLLKKEAGQFDVLLSDITMPSMSGVELAMRVAKEYPRVRILLMTGYPTEATQKIGEAGTPMVEVLRKPLQKQELLGRLRGFFGR